MYYKFSTVLKRNFTWELYLWAIYLPLFFNIYIFLLKKFLNVYKMFCQYIHLCTNYRLGDTKSH